MRRFTNVDHHPIEETPVRAHNDHPLLSLRAALDPLTSNINGLHHYIDTAMRHCRYPSAEGLTRDESAAIFLYTMNWGQHSLHRLLNDVLRIQDRNELRPWHGYLKLFSTALKKLPAVHGNIWRGVDADVQKNYPGGAEVTWWSFTSCSSSLSVIRQFVNSSTKSTVFMIEAKNARSIEKYSRYPDEHEIILDLGTRLRVLSDGFDRGDTNLVHLIELSSRASPSPAAIVVVPEEKNLPPIGFSGLVPIEVSPTPTDDCYEGDMKNGKRHGKGTCHYADGDTYVGNWIDNLPSGYGKYTTKGGGWYRGQLHQGKFHGKGTYHYESGDVYSGDFVDNQPEGKGLMRWKQGNRYKGEFKGGKLHGLGTLYYANGTSVRRYFVNGQVVL